MRNGLYFGTDIHLTGYKRVKTRERIGCKTDCFKMDFKSNKKKSKRLQPGFSQMEVQAGLSV